ncbi:hypothetical protein ACFY9Q_01925 [Streptomyces sp. NPDC012389]|uniref:hypothetical protein n=1 Tax=Streptomyces sp. NPDC012389 TaxID=3364830 RepID=UPI0036EB4703
MTIPLWVLMALIPELILTCVLLRWLPVKQERWVAAMPPPVTVVLAMAVRFIAETSWPTALATCAGFLWGSAVALVPFRGWVSSWTLPQHGEARLRWHEGVLAMVGAITPLPVKGTDTALEKTFAVRHVVRARGRFPLLMGVTLLVAPAACAVGAGWA